MKALVWNNISFSECKNFVYEWISIESLSFFDNRLNVFTGAVSLYWILHTSSLLIYSHIKHNIFLLFLNKVKNRNVAKKLSWICLRKMYQISKILRFILKYFPNQYFKMCCLFILNIYCQHAYSCVSKGMSQCHLLYPPNQTHFSSKHMWITYLLYEQH